MRKERFPAARKTKLHPRGDGPFRVTARINDNAYQLELPGEYNISSTFNVSDLSPFDFDADLLDSRTNPFEEGGDDAISGTSQPAPTGGEEDRDDQASRERTSTDKDRVTDSYSGPMTRLRAQRLRKELPELIQATREEGETSFKQNKETQPILQLWVGEFPSTEYISTVADLYGAPSNTARLRM